MPGTCLERLLDLKGLINKFLESRVPGRWISNTPPAQLSRFRYQLAPTFPSFHDLTERSADLTPRFAGCDARVVFGFELGALPRRDPLFQMQLADLLPCVWSLRRFLRGILWRRVAVISTPVRVELRLRCGWLQLFLMKSMVRLSSDIFTALPWAFAPKQGTPGVVFLIIVNAGLLITLFEAAIAGRTSFGVFLSLTFSAILFSNGCWHLWTSYKSHSYSPGTITGTLLYLPLPWFECAGWIRLGPISLWIAAMALSTGTSYPLWSALYHGRHQEGTGNTR